MFGLSFLSPAFLLGALVAAVPVALHLLGRRPRLQVAFPAVRLLARMPAQQTRRRRIRDLLLLALRVAALGLLAIGFARPYLAHAERGGAARAIVIAIDRSFSMSAPGQAERARAIARAVAGDVPAATPIGIVAFDDEATVMLKPTTDRAALRQAIDRVQPGFGATSYNAALARAVDLFGSAPGRVVVVTDLQRTGWARQDAAIPNRVDVTVRDVGAVVSNLAVTDLRRDDDGRVGVTVRNSGTRDRAGKVQLNVAGHVQAVRPFTLAAGAVQRLTFDAPGPTTGEISADLEDAAGYQGDNRAYGVLDSPEAPTLLAVTAPGDLSKGAFYLRQALEVDDRRLFRLDVVDGSAFSRVASAAYLRPYAAAIVLATRGMDAAAAATLRDYVAAGNGMLVTLSDQVEPSTLSTLLQAKAALRFEGNASREGFVVLQADSRHPLMRPLGPDVLAGARFERVAHAEFARQEVLARFGDGAPALSEIRSGRGRVLLFGSDLSNRWNDLPLQPAFLPLVHEIARYLIGGRVAGRDFTVAQAPAGVPHAPGVRMVEASGSVPLGKAQRPIVVNVDPAESDVTRMTVAEFGAAITRRVGSSRAPVPADPLQSGEQQRLWRAAIALAIVALLVEGSLGRMART